MPDDSTAKRSASLWRRLIFLYFRMVRGLTMGVRAVVLDGDGRVFLVRHTYVSGWHFPGGGVEAGETLHEALAKELSEEGHIRLTGKPLLHGVFLNRNATDRDHVAVFVVRDFAIEQERKPDAEIAEVRWFALGDLPNDTSSATRARLTEIIDGAEVTPYW